MKTEPIPLKLTLQKTVITTLLDEDPLLNSSVQNPIAVIQ